RCTNSWLQRPSCRTELTENPGDEIVQAVIEDEEIHPEERGGQDHHDGGRVDFLLRGPRHPLQLVANLAQKQTRTLEPAARCFSDVVESARRISGHSFQPSIRCFSILCLPRPSRRLAGQEGIEPPTPGFGDRCSAN